jgi:hypothetical protein
MILERQQTFTHVVSVRLMSGIFLHLYKNGEAERP